MKTVNIHGKDYETVESRIERFYADHDNGSILTQLLSDPNDAGKALFIATVMLGDDVMATGHAMELQGDGNINKHCHVENAETSAIGRALANWRYASGERPSAEEMQKATRTRPEPTQAPQEAPKAPVGVPSDWMNEPVGFGKHKEDTWIDVALANPGYFEWLAKQVDKRTGKPGKSQERAIAILSHVNNEVKEEVDEAQAFADECNGAFDDSVDDSVPF